MPDVADDGCFLIVWQGKGRDDTHAHAHAPRREFIVPLARPRRTRALVRCKSNVQPSKCNRTERDSDALLSVRRTLERRITYLCAISVATVTRTLHPHPLPFHMVHAPDPSWRPAAATSIRCRCSSQIHPPNASQRWRKATGLLALRRDCVLGRRDDSALDAEAQLERAKRLGELLAPLRGASLPIDVEEALA